jgi:hypothetical protein
MSDVKQRQSTEQLIEKIGNASAVFATTDPNALAKEVSEAFSKNAAFREMLGEGGFRGLVSAYFTSIEAGVANLLYEKNITLFNNRRENEIRAGIAPVPERVLNEEDELDALKSGMVAGLERTVEGAEKVITSLGDDKSAFSRSLTLHSLVLEKIAYSKLSRTYMEDIGDSMGMLFIGEVFGAKTSASPPSVLKMTADVAMEKERKCEIRNIDVTERLNKTISGAASEASSKWMSEFFKTLHSLTLPKLMENEGFEEKEVKSILATANLAKRGSRMSPDEVDAIVDDGASLVRQEFRFSWISHAKRHIKQNPVFICVIESEVGVMKALSEGKSPKEAMDTIIPDVKDMDPQVELVIVQDVGAFHKRGVEFQMWWIANGGPGVEKFFKRD